MAQNVPTAPMKRYSGHPLTICHDSSGLPSFSQPTQNHPILIEPLWQLPRVPSTSRSIKSAMGAQWTIEAEGSPMSPT